MKHSHLNKEDTSFKNRLKILVIQFIYLIAILIPLFSIKIVSYVNENVFSNLFLLYIISLLSLSVFFVIFWKSYSRFSDNLKFNIVEYSFLKLTGFYYFVYSLAFTSRENFLEDMKTFFYSLF